MDTPHIAIIGAGYAGLSAALKLTDAGFRTTVFEKRKTIGGRARAIDNPFAPPHPGNRLDNGQHVLTGAHRQTLQLIQRFFDQPPLYHLPAQLVFPHEFECHRTDHPAPFHWLFGLFRSPQCHFPEWKSAFKLGCHAVFNGRHAKWTVADLCQKIQASQTLQRYVIEPLCLAVFNAPTHQVSADLFLSIAKSLFFQDKTAADIFIPQCDLTQLLPQPIAEHLKHRQNSILCQHSVSAIHALEKGYEVCVKQSQTVEPYRVDGVIVAVSLFDLPAVVASLPALSALSSMVATVPDNTIDTLYLQFNEDLPLQHPMFGLTTSFGQWGFNLHPIRQLPGLVSVVHSAAPTIAKSDRPAFIEEVTEALYDVSGIPLDLPLSLWTTEKRATWRPVPGLKRPDIHTPLHRLMLAGDYTEAVLPATLEAAINSGYRSAEAMIETFKGRTNGVQPHLNS